MLKEEILELIEETAKNLGYTVYQSSVYLKGENTKIIVKIDSLKGISHNDCEMFSKELSAELTEKQLLPNFFLEISSPGVKRKISSPEEFERFIKAPVKIIYLEGEEKKVLKGEILSSSSNGVLVSSEGKEITIDFKDIVESNLDY